MNYQTLKDEQLAIGLCESNIKAIDAIYVSYWKMLYCGGLQSIGDERRGIFWKIQQSKSKIDFPYEFHMQFSITPPNPLKLEFLK